MSKSKNVEFDLFIPYYFQYREDGIQEISRYDLSVLFEHIVSLSPVDKKKRIFGDTHIFYKCEHHENLSIWELQILHLREQILPGIASEDGAYELIVLDEKSYPAESTTLLYDEKSSILYVQRNIFGTTIRALTALLQWFSPEETIINLKPCMKNSSIEKIKSSSYYRWVILTVDREQLTSEEQDTKLGKIINDFSVYNGKIVTISLGFGRKKKMFLHRKETIELLRQAYEFPGTEKLVASIAESEDGKIEKVDLLDDREKYIINMPYSRKNPITHERLYKECLDKIKNRY